MFGRGVRVKKRNIANGQLENKAPLCGAINLTKSCTEKGAFYEKINRKQLHY